MDFDNVISMTMDDTRKLCLVDTDNCQLYTWVCWSVHQHLGITSVTLDYLSIEKLSIVTKHILFCKLYGMNFIEEEVNLLFLIIQFREKGNGGLGGKVSGENKGQKYTLSRYSSTHFILHCLRQEIKASLDYMSK